LARKLLRGNDQQPALEKESRIRVQRSATVGERKWRRKQNGRTKNYQEEESATGARLRSRAESPLINQVHWLCKTDFGNP
jgi:hypothetical protein